MRRLFVFACLLSACSGKDDTGPVDADKDGVPQGEDCDDSNADVYPDASEMCDLLDNDCDSEVDEDPVDAGSWRIDADGDNYGAEGAEPIQSCTRPEGHAASMGDCDDNNPNVFPNKPELCDGLDQNCNDEVDEDPVDPLTWYMDGDGDGFGIDKTVEACLQPKGYADNEDDCDDEDELAYPDAPETCDGKDNDCDGFDEYCPDTLDSANTIFEGNAPGDLAFTDIASAGDMNDDFIGDLVVSAPGDTTGGSGAGAAFVFFGPISADRSLADANIKLTGPGNAQIDGVSAGDHDGDSISDLYIGAPGLDRLYVVSGPLTGTLALSLARDAVLTDDTPGNGLGSLGSFDGIEGFVGGPSDDLAVGRPGGAGSAYVFAGPLSGTLSLSGAALTLTGESPADDFGAVVRGVRDLTFDSIEDLAVAAPGANRVYLYAGPVSGNHAADAVATAILQGPTGSGFGLDLESAQDMNVDGYDDIIVGAPLGSGAAYFFYGPLSGTLDESAADAVFLGEEPGDLAGAQVSGGRIVAGDDAGDIFITAPGHDLAEKNGGAAYLILGPVSGTYDLAFADTRFEGTTASEAAGTSGGAIESTDGDSLFDLYIGAPAGDSETGKIYLFRGIEL